MTTPREPKRASKLLLLALQAELTKRQSERAVEQHREDDHQRAIRALMGAELDGDPTLHDAELDASAGVWRFPADAQGAK